MRFSIAERAPGRDLEKAVARNASISAGPECIKVAHIGCG